MILSFAGNIFHVKSTCATCGQPIEADRIGHSRYCLPCRRQYSKENRRNYNELTPVQKFKANVRSKAKMALRRGQITKKPCEVCGDPKTQMHHDDYNKPYAVIFLCQKHHKDRDREIQLKAPWTIEGPPIDKLRRFPIPKNAEEKAFLDQAMNLVKSEFPDMPQILVNEILNNELQRRKVA